jgi:ribosomal 30S subunit maturation factor RimM
MAVVPLRRIPRDQPASRDDRTYGLLRCHGCIVESAGREIGVVSEIRFASRADTPDLITVRTGRLRRRLLLIPVEWIDTIDLEAGRIRLAEEPPPGRAEMPDSWLRAAGSR